ncbi:MAG: lysozyme inhibitor LprI family protein [Polyangiaceae bacterium]
MTKILSLSLIALALAACSSPSSSSSDNAKKDETKARASGSASSSARGPGAAASASGPARPPGSATASAPATPTSAPTSAPTAQSALSFVAAGEELDHKCPMAEKDSNIEMKEEGMRVIECKADLVKKAVERVEQKLAGDTAALAAFKAEQASFDRYMNAACELEEERAWIDLWTGQRDDGTMRGYATLGCRGREIQERYFYLGARAADRADLVAARITEVQADGARSKAAIVEIEKAAAGWEKNPPPKSDESPVTADWKHIHELAVLLLKSAPELAKATCDGWSKLGSAATDCNTTGELYYIVQGNTPDINNQ